MNEITALELSSRIVHLLARERACLADVIGALADLHRNEGWRALGYTSLFYFCSRHLGLPNGSAWRRATGAELLVRFPILSEMLRDGRVSLRSLVKLREVLTEANHAELLAKLAGKSEQAAELLALEYRPRPVPRDTTSTVRLPPVLPLAAPKLPAAAEPVPPARETLQPLTPTLRRLHVTVSAELERKLETARGLLAHRFPKGEFEQIVGAALDMLIERETRRKAAVTSRPRRVTRATQPPARKNNHIPAAIRRFVWQRDGGRCSYPMPDGKVCGSQRALEFDHALEQCLGGRTSVDNLRLLCNRITG